MSRPQRKLTLMPLIALSTLSLMVTLPTLSANRLHAAGLEQTRSVTVRPGETLWTIAASSTRPGEDVTATVDRISAANHLSGGMLLPGQRLRIPQ